ncbi:Hypothetical predicted protein [Pelobates cultripes]|uniref:Uncharacterized protein n=1 Tax=Pelobates cultripes TaxID=61616 RepID=A0AAD1WTW5_PELCU|nr:Hypothetical predicted protein [Pelobates cultripes]
MPFLYTPQSSKVKRRLKAYPTPTNTGLEYFLDGGYGQREPDPASNPLPTHNTTPTNMGRRTQRSQPGHSAVQADIGTLLQRQAHSRMAAEATQALIPSGSEPQTPVQTEADSTT